MESEGVLVDGRTERDPGLANAVANWGPRGNLVCLPVFGAFSAKRTRGSSNLPLVIGAST